MPHPTAVGALTPETQPANVSQRAPPTRVGLREGQGAESPRPPWWVDSTRNPWQLAAATCPAHQGGLEGQGIGALLGPVGGGAAAHRVQHPGLAQLHRLGCRQLAGLQGVGACSRGKGGGEGWLAPAFRPSRCWCLQRRGAAAWGGPSGELAGGTRPSPAAEAAGSETEQAPDVLDASRVLSRCASCWAAVAARAAVVHARRAPPMVPMLTSRAEAMVTKSSTSFGSWAMAGEQPAASSTLAWARARARGGGVSAHGAGGDDQHPAFLTPQLAARERQGGPGCRRSP